MGAASKGALAIAGYKKSTAGTWDTPILIGAGNGIEFLKDNITTKNDLLENTQVNGSITQFPGDKGNRHESGGVDVQAKYETLETLIAMAMGTAGAPAQQGGSDRKSTR